MKHTQIARTRGLVVLSLIALGAVANADPQPSWYSHLVPVPQRGAPLATAPAPDQSPATTASQHVVDALETLRTSMRQSHYRHSTHVNVRAGVYDFDCSGFVGWILARTAPVALAAAPAPHGRPLAANFAQAIERASDQRVTHGWLRVTRLADARPGDVFAWKKPSWFPDSNTGHVGFIVSTPEPDPAIPGYFRVRIADSNPTGHEADTRDASTSGFGMGTILLSVDPVTGEGTGLALGGSRAQWNFPVKVLIGRVVR